MGQVAWRWRRDGVGRGGWVGEGFTRAAERGGGRRAAHRLLGAQEGRAVAEEADAEALPLARLVAIAQRGEHEQRRGSVTRHTGLAGLTGLTVVCPG